MPVRPVEARLAPGVNAHAGAVAASAIGVLIIHLARAARVAGGHRWIRRPDTRPPTCLFGLVFAWSRMAVAGVGGKRKKQGGLVAPEGEDGVFVQQRLYSLKPG